MKMKKVICVVMATTMLMSTSTFANDSFVDNMTYVDSNGVSATIDYDTRLSIPWATIVWKVSKYANSVFYNHTGTSYNGSNYTSVSTGTINFNNSSDDVGASVYKDLNVTSANSKLDVFAETNILNWADKISIIITNKNGNDVANKSVAHEQHVYYDINSSAKTGNYKVRFVENDKSKWNCWIYFYDWTARNAEDTSKQYIDYDNKRYYYPTETVNYSKTIKSSNLDANDIYGEFFDKNLNKSIYYSKNYNLGDKVIFTDVIDDVYYDEELDRTTMYFNTSDYDDVVPFTFSGDLRDGYKIGDSLSLSFKIEDEYTDKNGFVFETLDYLNDAKSYTEYGAPIIDAYLYE